MEQAENAVMTVREVSEYLKLAESTIYKLVEEGKVPGCRKIGGAWRFSRKRLEEWVRGEGQDGKTANRQIGKEINVQINKATNGQKEEIANQRVGEMMIGEKSLQQVDE